ncbi:helix-turn-helix domain-containing protein [Erwinia persicina]|uniref:helix-turn-helix domain-containing protein n=1 Tax=Erwinia persicina TaxID=55211 RepID=UPI00177FE29E|nr:LuxR C-terminal-related transcriptional regulator [Erwinia persicina]MBD8162658.1 helix-turn-helix transcriptional regulator [Erwinia persicina]
MDGVIKILIVDSNNLFSMGLKTCIERYFSEREIPIAILSSPQDYPLADLIFWAPNSSECPLPSALMKGSLYRGKLILIMSQQKHWLALQNFPFIFYRHQDQKILQKIIEDALNNNYDKHPEDSIAMCEKALTLRQEQVLYLLSCGMCSKKVADILHISNKTVSCHKRNAMNILNMTKSTELYEWFIGNSMAEAQ